ncbi:MAG TPA: LysM domain-containing protein, partial [Burkholderiales bacterium]|nr:LysM domain-containing protein [Burkholderiales bacterium]
KLTLLALVAGCATAPEPAKAPESAAKSEAETPSEPGASSNPAKAPSRPLVSGPAAKAEVQKILRQAFDWLDAGDEEKARVELEYANQLDPDNKQVSCLLRGVTADPVTVLGKESTAYTVRAGETLGLIARRAMGDVCEFYILARYNQIKVPKLLSSGQTIRIPGRVVLGAPEAAPAASKPAAAVPKPDTAPVVEAAKPKPTPPPEPDDRAKRAEIDRHHRNAQAAYRRQDLATAIREWDALLALDPNNNLARVRKQEALELQAKLDGLKK